MLTTVQGDSRRNSNLGTYARLKDQQKLDQDLYYIIGANGDNYECLRYDSENSEYKPSRLLLPRSSLIVVENDSQLIDKSTEPPITSNLNVLGYINACLHDYLQFLNKEEFQSSPRYPDLVQIVAEISSSLKELTMHELPEIEQETVLLELMDLITAGNEILGLDHLILKPNTNLSIKKLIATSTFNEYFILETKPETKESENYSLNFEFACINGTICKLGEKIEIEFYIHDIFSEENISESLFVTVGLDGKPMDNRNIKLSCCLSKSQMNSLDNLALVCRVSSQSTMRPTSANSSKSVLGPLRRQLSKIAA